MNLQSFWLAIIFVLGGLSYVPYFISMKKGDTIPSISGWSVYTLSLLLIILSSLAENSYSSVVIGSIMLVCQAVIIGWGVRLQQFVLTRFDKLLIAISLASVVLWLVSDNPEVALTINVGIDALGTFLIARKTFRHPGTENSLTWMIGTLAALINLLVFFDYTVKNSLFPVYLLIANCLVCLLSLRKPVKPTCLTPKRH